MLLNREIPFYNIILRCDSYPEHDIMLPAGYYFKFFSPGDETMWARLEYEIGDFDSLAEAEHYFAAAYCKEGSEIEKRCIFVIDDQGETVGSCIAWRDRDGAGTVASLHWLVVSLAAQDKKIGKALCRKIMAIFHSLEEYPVYIHTQPWSYKAVLLYVRQGFKIMTTAAFSGYENQYVQAMDTLRQILPAQQYEELVFHSTDEITSDD